EAALQAEARGAPHVASELYQLAATVTPPEDKYRALRRRRLSAGNLFAAGDARGARELNEAMLAELEPGPARVETLYAISYMSWNDLPRVRKFLERTLEEASANDPLLPEILADLAWVKLIGEPSSALTLARSAVALAEAGDNPFSLRNALSVQAL